MNYLSTLLRRLTNRTPEGSKFSARDIQFMQHALALASKAESENEVPVGAIIVKDNEIIGEGYNQSIGLHDPTAHAEILAIRNAAKKQKNYRLVRTSAYMTLEPCVMCAMALVHARVDRIVFAARDFKTGAAGSAFQILPNELHNHRAIVESGLLQNESSALISGFFARRRAEKKKLKQKRN